MKKKTIYIIAISLFVFCFSASFVVYQLFIKDSLDTQTGASYTEDKIIDSDIYGLTDTVDEGVILQAWCWSFNTIKENMADIAYAGFSSIQTSPINACVEGGNGGMQLNGEGKWWYHYQPTDWTIGNYQFGTREEFIAMCKEADKYGIKIIVDVVPNHTGPTEEVLDGLINGVGGISKLYHTTGKTTIENYGDRLQCTMWAMDGLLDVNTENPAFQDYFISYINDCIECGVDGFRYDTAKHIALPDDPVQGTNTNNFWTRVLAETNPNGNIFNYGEVLQGDNDRLSAYVNAIGHTTASNYGQNLRNAVLRGTLSSATVLNYSVGSVDSSSLVTWFESHDNYLNDGSYRFTDDQVVTGWTIIAATGNGTPLFYSRPYGNSTSNLFGTLNRIGLAGNNTFKDERIVAVNRFHNATVGEPCKVVNLDSSNKVLSIERGSIGAVIINTNESPYSVNSSTGLADGTYTDHITGTATFTVSAGKITGSIPSKSTVVLCNSDKYVSLDKIAIPDVKEGTLFTSFDETQSVTLVATNATKATYSVNGGEPIEYKDGQTVTLGADCEYGSSYDLVLKATNSAGHESTRTFTFLKKEKIVNGTIVYFEPPSSWKTPVYAYVYDESTSQTKKNANWPGVEMTKGSDGKYSYRFTEPWDQALVIFTDGSNQFPKAMEPGCDVVGGKTYTVE